MEEDCLDKITGIHPQKSMIYLSNQTSQNFSSLLFKGGLPASEATEQAGIRGWVKKG